MPDAAVPVTTAIAVIGVLGASTLTGAPTAASVVRTTALVGLVVAGLLLPQRASAQVLPRPAGAARRFLLRRS